MSGQMGNKHWLKRVVLIVCLADCLLKPAAVMSEALRGVWSWQTRAEREVRSHDMLLDAEVSHSGCQLERADPCFWSSTLLSLWQSVQT